MNRLNCELPQATDRGLQRLVEPLASFICATEQPRVSLTLALGVLLSQVDELNRAASAYVGCAGEPHGLC
jgi:hypothetical protein